MAERSFWRSLGNLALALLNATLILVALCLWLALSTLSATERVSAQLAEAAETVLPLRAEIAALTEQIAAAHAELADSRDPGAAPTALEVQLARIEAELAELTAAVAGLAGDRDVLIERAVEAFFTRLGRSVGHVLATIDGSDKAP